MYKQLMHWNSMIKTNPVDKYAAVFLKEDYIFYINFLLEKPPDDNNTNFLPSSLLLLNHLGYHT